MSSGQSIGVTKEWVYVPELYLPDLCFSASLKGPFPTEYQLSDVLSISLWALETGMNVMSSFGRLCCLSFIYSDLKPHHSGNEFRTDFESLAVMSGSLRSGTLGGLAPAPAGLSEWVGVWWWIVVKLCLRWAKIQLHLSESLYHNDDEMSLYWVQPCLWHSCCAL